MVESVRHLNCGTLKPFGRRFINGDGLPVQTARLVCHCLLVETDAGLVLVDTGFGVTDIAARRAPLPSDASKTARRRRRVQRFMTRPLLDPDESAARQLSRLGYSTDDVRHIVLTHLDNDHTGGLADFPSAKVHVLASEYEAAMAPATAVERFRYWGEHWAHGPEWVTYARADDDWLGIEAVVGLEDLPDFALVPLPGHTRAQAGVAVRTTTAAGGPRWLLHAADAYFFRGEMDAERPRCTPGLARFQIRLEIDGDARRRSQERLRRLALDHWDDVEMFCSHDPVELDERLRPA